MGHFDPKRISLKARIVVSFFSILLVMIGASFFTLQRFIVHFTETQLDDDYENMLSEACDTIEDLLWNLTLTSGQILDNESIRDTLILYQETESPYERQTHYVDLLDSITMLTLANTDVSLLYIYDESDKDFVYSSFPVNKDRRNQAPVLYQNVAFSFCGPYQSQSNYNGNPVLILNRTETLPNGRSVVLSIESGFYSLLTPIKSTERKSAYLAVTGSNGDLIYTTLPDKTSAEAMDILDGSKEYRTMSKSMPQGWGVHLVIPNRVYRMDYYQSLSDILLCMVVIAAFVTLIAVYFWKSVYSPLRLFDKQLEFLLADENDSGQMRSSIPEYDYLLQKIGSMQKEIQEMIRRIIAQEKDNTKMQIEKLRAQINPHFLLNTLNTVHWMALMNEQEEIDAITQSLAHLLSYNLDKDRISTNLEKELKALTEYVHLQRVRYDFHFTIDRPALNGKLNYPCPKFLLQPLVENALSHGYRPGMVISVHILVDDLIRLTVSDTGTGMDAETLARVNNLQPSCELDIGTAYTPSEDRISKFGIGLAYVVNSMHDFFSDSFQFSISSSENQETTIQIEFPKLKGSDYHVKDIDR